MSMCMYVYMIVMIDFFVKYFTFGSFLAPPAAVLRAYYVRTAFVLCTLFGLP